MMTKTFKDYCREEYGILQQCSTRDADVMPLHKFRNQILYTKEEVDEIRDKAFQSGFDAGHECHDENHKNENI